MIAPTWQAGDCSLYLGDCLDILPQLAAGSVDAVVADPPYGTQELGGGYGRRQNWDPNGRNGRQIENDVDLSIIQNTYPEFVRILINGWAAVFFAARKKPQFIEATSSKDWFGHIIWNKGAPGLGYTIRYSHEDVAIFRIGDPPKPKSAICSIINAPRIGIEHPHEKPLSVLIRLIEWISLSNKVILDPYMGIASTGVACVQTGRKFIGIEIEPKYFDIAVKRIQQAQLQIRMEI